LAFDGTKIRERRCDWTQDDAALAPVRGQLEAYFRGELKTFDVPLAFAGTPFQQSVWRALAQIPFGATTSYGELALRVGRPKYPGAQEVGVALNQNPIAVIAPCHRVIGANGSLVGFGGGLERKRWLLSHDGAAAAPEDDAQTTLPL
jgi:methylated-DNA-[protein]-cysteine S-methyltransferase